MRNARLLYPALLVCIVGSGLQSCSQDPQRQAAQHPHFEPPVDSTEYYAERNAYYREHAQVQPVVVERVYHTAHYYHNSPRYYTDPYSVYNDPHAHGFHRSWEEESQYETTHHEGGSKVGTAVAAGAAGLAAGVAAGYVAGKRSATATVRGAASVVSPALGNFGKTTLARNAVPTKTPQLLTPTAKPSAPATYSKTPSPTFTVPPAPTPRPTATAPRPVYSLSASPPASRRTITVTKPSSPSPSRPSSSSTSRSRSGGFIRGRR